MSQGPGTPNRPPASDPHNVGEVFVNGPINCSVTGQIATLVFTAVRPDADALIQNKRDVVPSAVVVSRLVMPVGTLVEIRNMLNRLIRDNPAPQA
jgi:hypothetical protein